MALIRTYKCLFFLEACLFSNLASREWSKQSLSNLWPIFVLRMFVLNKNLLLRLSWQRYDQIQVFLTVKATFKFFHNLWRHQGALGRISFFNTNFRSKGWISRFLLRLRGRKQGRSIPTSRRTRLFGRRQRTFSSNFPTLDSFPRLKPVLQRDLWTLIRSFKSVLQQAL